MDIESVKSLFLMFSGEESCDEWSPLINLAVSETDKMLRPDADRSDVRLGFLCAAAANRRLQQIKASRERSQSTFAGKVLTQTQNSALHYAEKLYSDYIQLCNDLIEPSAFVFAGFSNSEEAERKC